MVYLIWQQKLDYTYKVQTYYIQSPNSKKQENIVRCSAGHKKSGASQQRHSSASENNYSSSFITLLVET